MFVKRKKFVGSITKVSLPEFGVVHRNRIWLTYSPHAGLYLINIMILGYKFWFGFTNDFIWMDS